jgi:hypothetical protein
MAKSRWRILSVLVVSLAFCLPLHAEGRSAGGGVLPSFLLGIWERLTAPLSAVFAADETDGRQGFDPNGLTATGGERTRGENTDGRQGLDPNG